MSAAESHSNLTVPSLDDSDRDRELLQVREALRGLRFGAIQIHLQDGVVIQIDRTEKRRVARVQRQGGSLR